MQDLSFWEDDELLLFHERLLLLRRGGSNRYVLNGDVRDLDPVARAQLKTTER